MKRTKIVCTLGPASSTPEMLEEMFKAGMNVGRLNFSHGTHASHKENIKLFRKVRDSLEIPAALMLDTKGPEVRLETFKDGKTVLKKGDDFTITMNSVIGDNTRASVTYKTLNEYVKKGTKILLDDGAIALSVKSVSGADILCKVLQGGPVSDHKGVNIKGIPLDMIFLSQKDKSDILFGIENNIDYIAASFVRTSEDVADLRKFLNDNGGKDVKIIAKIENQQGVKNFKKILSINDGIMVARGDMGVEIDYEKLPGIQKRIIDECCKEGKIAITATQMLDSMTNNPSPTRAEITDVANAVFDGTSAVMLSGESAAGKYPLQAVKTMSKIAIQAEKDAFEVNAYAHLNKVAPGMNTTKAIAHAACTTARDLGAKAILAITKSGTTATGIAKYRPKEIVIACTPMPKTYHQLSLTWGVHPVKTELYDSFSQLLENSIKAAKKTNLIKDGDLIVDTGGSPVQVEGTTNLIRVDQL